MKRWLCCRREGCRQIATPPLMKDARCARNPVVQNLVDLEGGGGRGGCIHHVPPINPMSSWDQRRSIRLIAEACCVSPCLALGHVGLKVALPEHLDVLGPDLREVERRCFSMPVSFVSTHLHHGLWCCPGSFLILWREPHRPSMSWLAGIQLACFA